MQYIPRRSGNIIFRLHLINAYSVMNPHLYTNQGFTMCAIRAKNPLFKVMQKDHQIGFIIETSGTVTSILGWLDDVELEQIFVPEGETVVGMLASRWLRLRVLRLRDLESLLAVPVRLPGFPRLTILPRTPTISAASAKLSSSIPSWAL